MVQPYLLHFVHQKFLSFFVFSTYYILTAVYDLPFIQGITIVCPICAKLRLPDASSELCYIVLRWGGFDKRTFV